MPKPAQLHLFENRRIRIADLFAGIGGFRAGFECLQPECVFTSEWNKFSQQTYLANFPGSVIHGDIRTVASEDVPDHDVLLAGFPCQPFSLAGVSKKVSLGRAHGFKCETQGTLFFEIERILRVKRPAAFVLENVKNLLSHDRGRTFDVIRRTLQDNLGYNIAYRVLDARAVVPQHRERIFIVGLRGEDGKTFDFDRVTLSESSQKPELRNILHSRHNFVPGDPYTDDAGEALEKYVLSSKLWSYLQAYKAKHASLGNGFGFGLSGPGDVARTLSARYYKDGAEILIRRGKSGRARPRRLTPRECARLMGFDSPKRPIFKIPVSDNQAYRQFGNAVVVPVIEAIARALPEFLPDACRQVDVKHQRGSRERKQISLRRVAIENVAVSGDLCPRR
jgi:DNA (cytosine-5)-methyltransferase 1